MSDVQQPGSVGRTIQFGDFEFDVRAGELRKHGIRIRLQEQPLQILTLLLEHPGEVVLREEIRRRLWPDGTIVEFGPGINAAVQRLRDALCDSAEAPRFVETVARRGYRFIGELRAGLSSAESGGALPLRSDLGCLPGSEEKVAESGPRRQRATMQWMWIGVAVLTALAVALGTGFRRENLRQPARVARLTIAPPEEGAAFLSGFAGGLAISPDGRTLAYVARLKDGRARLFVRALDSVDSTPVPGGEAASIPIWSPDSRSIAFVTPEGMMRTDIASGTRQRISGHFAALGGSWNRKGVILLVNLETGINRVPASGGDAQPVFPKDVTDQYASQTWPWFLPDGDHFLFSARSTGGDTPAAIYVSSLSNPRERIKIRNEPDPGPQASDVRPVFAVDPSGNDGWLLVAGETAIIAQRLDTRALKLVGDPVAIDRGPRYSEISVSTTGAMVYAEDLVGVSRLLLRDRHGSITREIGQPGHYGRMRFSPDGRVLAVMRDNDIWILDLERGSERRLTFRGINRVPAWSPDGNEISWYRQGAGIYRRKVGGGEEQLIHSGKSGWVWCWSNDGANVIYSETTDQATHWLLPLEMPDKPRAIAGYAGGVLSSDGRRMAYMSRESGYFQIYIQPFPPTGAQWLISGGQEPRWRADGAELFYESGAKLYAVPVKTSQGNVSAGSPQELFAVSGAWDVTGDGQHFASAPAGYFGGPSRPVVVLNWTASLQR